MQLKLAPQRIGGNFNCNLNQLTSLKGAPQEVHDFRCSGNELTSLEGAPKTVHGIFDCSYNKLISLSGAPNYIAGTLDCCNNPDLHSLDGIGEVKGGIYKDF